MEQGVSGGVKALSRAILDDTKIEAEQIVAQAQQAAASIKQKAAEEAARIRQEILDNSRNEVSRFRQQTLATARLEAQRILLTQREELINSVFDQAARRLPTLRQRDDYGAILRSLVVEAVEQLGEPAECIVRLAEPDRMALTEAELSQLAERWGGRVHLQLGEVARISGGAILETTDGRQRYDNSLEARLMRARSRLRARVFQLLQGEK